MPLLHIINAKLKKSITENAKFAALEKATNMSNISVVNATVSGFSEQSIGVGVWLNNTDDLETFAASEEHLVFIMQGLAPIIDSLWSAAIDCSDLLPRENNDFLFWLYAFPDHEGVFEWEIQKMLNDISLLPGESWDGITIEERDRFRAGGIVIINKSEYEIFSKKLEDCKSAWKDRVESLTEEFYQNNTYMTVRS